MSGRPKYVTAVTPPSPPRDITLEQKAKHRSQIASARSAALRSKARAVATGALTKEGSEELGSILTWLDAATALSMATALDELRGKADQAAEKMRRSSAIAADASRRAAELEARSRELAAIDQACKQDLSKVVDPALSLQGRDHLDRLSEARTALAAGRLATVEAKSKREVSETALVQLVSAQSELDVIYTYIADLSRIGIDCTNEQLAAQERIRHVPAEAQASRREFEGLVKTRISASADQRRQQETKMVAARYAQWNTLQARRREREVAAEEEVRSCAAEAPDAAKVVMQSLERLSSAVNGLGNRWAPAEVEPAFGDLDTMLSVLRKKVESQRMERAEVERCATGHAKRLQAKLEAAVGVEDSQAQGIENNIDSIRGLASAAEVERRSRALEADIDNLVAAAAKPRPQTSAQEAVIMALSRLGERHGADWDEAGFEQLRAASLDEDVTISGRFGEDGSSINLIVRLSREGTSVEDEMGTKVGIECHDGEGRACGLVMELPQELYRTEAFVVAKGSAGTEWPEVKYNAETVPKPTRGAGGTTETERARQL